MHSIFIVGLIIFVGFVLGELAEKARLPKISGYILAGILLNPRLLPIIPDPFTKHTDLITDIALSFITFSVGGTLLVSRIKRLGRTIVLTALFEAELALIFVLSGFLLVQVIFGTTLTHIQTALMLPLSVLLGSLALPTDPSATLAVTHEYKARGDLPSTVMGVAALDDALGIVNYSLCIAVAQVLLTEADLNWTTAVAHPILEILGGVLLGLMSGWVFNCFFGYLQEESEGSLIVIVAASLMLCFGSAKVLGCDELLSTMAMGCIVANLNPVQDRIFHMIERYTEELIFVLFFTLSGMHLMFSAVQGAVVLICLFVLFRLCGKIVGSLVGARLAKAPKNIRNYVGMCLVPQGGIVIGLALSMREIPVFQEFSDLLIGIIIGSVIIHELIGPILAKMALFKARAIKQ
ncbi:MAG: cation:proton antiporter [Thermodesulfobacteriota bacterium]